MLRPGRLDKLLYVPLPTEQGRIDILKTLTRHAKFSPGFDISIIARDKRCEHFSGADLQSLVREATLIALRPALSNTGPSPEYITMENYNEALNKIRASVTESDQKKYERMNKEINNSK